MDFDGNNVALFCIMWSYSNFKREYTQSGAFKKFLTNLGKFCLFCISNLQSTRLQLYGHAIFSLATCMQIVTKMVGRIESSQSLSSHALSVKTWIICKKKAEFCCMYAICIMPRANKIVDGFDCDLE